MMQRHRLRNRGFTLLEVLVASAIISILLAQIALVLFVTFRARRSASNGAEETRALVHALNVVGRDVSSYTATSTTLADPAKGTDGSTAWGTDGDSLRMVVVAEPSRRFDGASDLQEVTLELIDEADLNPSTFAESVGSMGRSNFLGSNMSSTEQDDGPRLSNPEPDEVMKSPFPSAPRTGVLVRRVRRNLLALDTQTAEDQVIARNVRSFNLRYFNPLENVWLESFDLLNNSTDTLAISAVEVTIETVPAPSTGSTSDSDQSQSRKISRVIPMINSRLGTVTDGSAVSQ